MTDMLRDCLQRLPLIAILRGMKTEEAPWVLETLADFSILEVPLNSPRPLESIAYLVRHAPSGVLIGAGTVLTAAEVADVAATGAKLIIAPNCAPPVIAATLGRRLAAAGLKPGASYQWMVLDPATLQNAPLTARTESSPVFLSGSKTALSSTSAELGPTVNAVSSRNSSWTALFVPVRMCWSWKTRSPILRPRRCTSSMVCFCDASASR